MPPRTTHHTAHMLSYLQSSIQCSIYISELILAPHCLPPHCFLIITCQMYKVLLKNLNSCNNAVHKKLFYSLLIFSHLIPDLNMCESPFCSPVGFSHLFISSFLLLYHSWWIRVKMLVSKLWLCWMNREVSYGEKHIMESFNEVVQQIIFICFILTLLSIGYS